MLNSRMYILLTQVSAKSDINSTVPTSKGRFSLRQFSRNSQSLHFFGTFLAKSYPNPSNTVESGENFHLTPMSKVCLSLLRFSRTSRLLAVITIFIN